MKKLFLVMAVVLLSTASAGAHEFIVKPVQLSAKIGSIIPFSVVSAHVFMISEEMEPLNQVETTLYEGGKATAITLEPNSMLMTLDGQIKAESAGSVIIGGHRKGMIWTQTTSGWKQASKKGMTGVISSGKYEKFCKTLVTIDAPDDNFGKSLGHRLEIVPMSNPALARTGDEIVFKTLFDGKEISTENVLATYDGFTLTPNTYAYFTEPYGQGLSTVKITHPGVWMVRVQHVIKEGTPDYDRHVLRAVLVFEVK